MDITAGQQLTAKLRAYFHVGPRTRRYRGRTDLHAEMAQAVNYAATLPGYYIDDTQNALRAGFSAVTSWDKHIGCYRAAPSVTQAVNGMTAWQFAGLLGQMVDAGVTCTGDGERFFAAMAA